MKNHGPYEVQPPRLATETYMTGVAPVFVGDKPSSLRELGEYLTTPHSDKRNAVAVMDEIAERLLASAFEKYLRLGGVATGSSLGHERWIYKASEVLQRSVARIHRDALHHRHLETVVSGEWADMKPEARNLILDIVDRAAARMTEQVVPLRPPRRRRGVID